MSSNKSLAEYNMSQEPVLREGKERLAEKHSQATALSSGLRSLQSELQSKSGQVRGERRAGADHRLTLHCRSDRRLSSTCCRPPCRRRRTRART